MTLGQIEEFGSDITFDVNGKNIVCPRFAYVNGELKSEFYDIRNGDAVRIENFYTVGQLFTFWILIIQSMILWLTICRQIK